MIDEIDDAYKNLSRETGELVKEGKFKEVLRLFRKKVDINNPTFIGAMRMIASGMKAAGDISAAHNVYTNIYETLVKQGGEKQPEVLKSLIDVILSSSSIKLSYELTMKGLETSIEINDEKLIDEFNMIKDEVFSKFTATQRRIYTKLENKKNTNIKPVNKKTHNSTVEPYIIDEIMKEFGLE